MSSAAHRETGPPDDGHGGQGGSDDGAGRLLDKVLRPGELHLWYGFLEDLEGSDLEARYWDLLSETERVRHAAFLSHGDAQRYLFTRALVRTVLSHYVDVAPTRWVFGRNAHGRPTVSHPDGAPSAGLSFNVSHSAGLVVMIVARDARIGVDTESSDRAIGAEVVDRVLTAHEARALRDLPARQQGGRFIDLWTLKESWTKAIGTGLDFPPRSIGFVLEEGAPIRARLEEGAVALDGVWTFLLFSLSDHHRVAISTDQMPHPILLCWRSLPLVRAESVELGIVDANRQLTSKAG
jgi:4'-phosphopantetheinyl transferase